MKKLAFFLLIIIFIVQLFSLEIGKVELPDELKLENDTLILNGAGLRKKLIISSQPKSST